MAGIYILLVLTLAGVVLTLYTLWRSGRPEATPAADAPDGADAAPAEADAESLFVQALERLQVKWNVLDPGSDEDPDTVIGFEYQGGRFVATFRKDAELPFFNTVSVSFFNCFSLPADHLDKCGMLANTINSLMQPVKCTFGLGDSESTAGEVCFNLHASALRMQPEVEANVEQLTTIFAATFHLRQRLVGEFVSHRDESPSEIELNALLSEERRYAIARMECTDPKMPTAKFPDVWLSTELTLGEVLKRLFDYTIPDDAVMMVDGAPVAAVTAAEISAHRLLATLVEGSGPDARVMRPMSAIWLHAADANSRDAMIAMSAERHGDRLIEVRVSAMLSGLPARPQHTPQQQEWGPVASEFVLGVPCVTPEAFLAEAKYMADELRLLDYCRSAPVAYSLYWGRVLTVGGRHLEAIEYLLCAYDQLNAMLHNRDLLPEGEFPRDALYEVDYLLGVNYCGLGRYRDAYYYLQLIQNPEQVLHIQQYLSCLMALRDPRAEGMITHLREQLSREPSAGDDDEESASDDEPQSEARETLRRFLDHQMVVLHIYGGRIEQALSMLHSIRRNGSGLDGEFADYWTEYIRQHYPQQNHTEE